jgi:hypothetical protein
MGAFFGLCAFTGVALRLPSGLVGVRDIGLAVALGVDGASC